jgi:sec-independent protein translocase protein TatA
MWNRKLDQKESHMGSFGVWEWLIILAIVIIIFGVGRLPEVGSALGKAIRGFRESVAEEDEEEQAKDTDEEAKSA